ncbi:MAG TPA: FAD-binding protein [Gemmatimonadaceae bacterium]|nr:FAD-binding protein [Gemmatimonadaceae bacterium]
MSTERVAATVRESAANGASLRIAGCGTWLDAGRPVSAARTLSLADDRGVVSYVPGDLTLTVRAGTPLSEIGGITGEHSQWLPLDPHGTNDGTIGATLATASAGPLASGFGPPRDLLLGVEFVNGRGEVIRAGGRVVKNVAGFDLSRLVTGSWGTLGVITEVTVRLYAMPQADRTFAIALGGTEREVGTVVRGIITSPLSPFAFQLISRSMARALGLGDDPIALLRFGGSNAVVDAQVSGLTQLATPREVDNNVWISLRALDGDAHTAVRVSSLPQRFAAASARILGDDVPGIYTCIDPRRGVMRILVGSAASGDGGTDTTLAPEFAANGGSSAVVFEKLPADLWASVSPSVVADPLSQGIRKAFDPHNVLNPGILGS